MSLLFCLKWRRSADRRSARLGVNPRATINFLGGKFKRTESTLSVESWALDFKKRLYISSCVELNKCLDSL